MVHPNPKINFKYINTILESWHKKGYKKPSDIKDDEDKKIIKSDTSYSVDSIKQKVNKFD